MSLNLYNTLTRLIEPVEPKENEPIRMYTCGPTVYNYVHIGNLRSYISADLLYRTLKFNGFKVDYVMNITDIEDKIIKATIDEFGPNANIENLRTFTTRYLDAFLEDLKAVNIDPDNIRIIRVTDVIPQIQDFIVKLIDKGYAYKTEDGVFFSIEKYQADFHDYGALVGEKFLEGKKIGARVLVDEYEKENLSDFALWKNHTPEDGQIFWDHEVLGKGRPGWHIECSVINKVAFGDNPIDLHTGGVDLIFPHHTNEIAQSKPLGEFVKHWMHAEHLMVQNDKMAKSKKNFYTLRDIEEKGFSGLDLRYSFLQSHYKTQANFSWEALEAAHSALAKLKNSAANLNSPSEPHEHFLNAINEDLNLPKALAAVWSGKTNPIESDQVLGLKLEEQSQPNEIEIPEEVQKLINERKQARDSKDFTRSDQLRDEIENLGFTVKDTSTGQAVQQIKKTT
jgi:cysteinyl-tRNA synthetase